MQQKNLQHFYSTDQVVEQQPKPVAKPTNTKHYSYNNRKFNILIICFI